MGALLPGSRAEIFLILTPPCGGGVPVTHCRWWQSDSAAEARATFGPATCVTTQKSEDWAIQAMYNCCVLERDWTLVFRVLYAILLIHVGS